MKKSIIALAAGLLFSSLSMALTPEGMASDSPVILPCGKIFTKHVARDDKKTNFYAQMLAKGGSQRVTPQGIGKSTN